MNDMNGVVYDQNGKKVEEPDWDLEIKIRVNTKTSATSYHFLDRDGNHIANENNQVPPNIVHQAVLVMNSLIGYILRGMRPG